MLTRDFEALKSDIKETSPIPICHNDKVIYLQYSGWSINLYSDGTYAIECTEGG